jgi:predicted dehydrogenase
MNTNPVPLANERATRRSFLKKTATATAAVSVTNLFKTPVYGQNQAPSTGVTGANDRIVTAFIGVGSQGSAHLRSQKAHAGENNVALAAVCDVYKKRLKKAQDFLELPDSSAYDDHRKLLERKDIDAVTIATVDNWHAQVAVDALNAGKHVYGEKPMARYLMEGFEMYDAVKKTGKVYQVGSQYCADPMVHKAAEWIKAGKIGPLVWCQGSYCRNNAKSEWTFAPDPDANENNLDWKRWQGKARPVPWDPVRYFSWHKFFDYNSGILGNLLSHLFLPLMMATGNPEFPRRVVCTGTRKISTDRQIPDTTHLLAELPSGLTMCVAGSTVNEQGLPQVIRGHKGTITFAASNNRAELKPERIFADEVDPESFNDDSKIGEIYRLEKNFFDCIRSGQAPYANVDLAIRVHTILCLAEMSQRLNLSLLFDSETRTIKDGHGNVVKAIDYDSVVPCFEWEA